MTRAERLQIEAASELLNSLGMRWSIGPKKKHTSIEIFDSRGHVHRVQIASSPRSDEAAVHYTKMKVRDTVTRILQIETARRNSRGV